MVLKDVYFHNGAGHKLAGILRYNESIDSVKYPVVIVLHGFAEDKHNDFTADIANGLVGQGFLTFRFDFHGHGESEGDFEEHTIEQQIDDVVCAIDFISGLDNVDPEKIAVVGTDIGGNIAMLVASKDLRVNVLVVQGARSHIEKHLSSWFHEHDMRELMGKGFFEHSKFKIRKDYVEDARSYDFLGSVSLVNVPLLIVHGLADMRVRLNESRELYVHAKQPKYLEEVEGADHWFRGREKRELFLKLCSGWIKKYLG